MTAEVALPAILGLHHVKVAVSDLPRSRAWYERVLAVQLAVEFRDEGDERIRGVAYAPVGGFTLALRERGDVVATGFDPFAILVADRAAINGCRAARRSWRPAHACPARRSGLEGDDSGSGRDRGRLLQRGARGD